MQFENTNIRNPRIAFLLLLAFSITFVFFWVIKSFLVAIIVSAVLASILYPFYQRVNTWLDGRKGISALVTVLLSLFLIIIPLLFFMGILVEEAITISESAEGWFKTEVQQPEMLQQHLQAHPKLEKLLPYKDKIIAKVPQLAAKVGTFVAEGLAAGAKGTAEFLLMIFIMLFAMSYFLTEGSALLDTALRFTPLSSDDKERLLNTFSSVGRATLKGTLVIGIVQGGLGGLSFWFAGIKGAFFWAVVMAVSSVIPSVGTALVWVPAVIFLVLKGQIGAAVGVGLWCAVIVGSADNFLRPLLIGRDTEMPDIVVMLTTFGGLALFGIAGLLIGPIIGALYITIWNLCGTAIDEAAGKTKTAVIPSSLEESGHGEQ